MLKLVFIDEKNWYRCINLQSLGFLSLISPIVFEDPQK